ncbi:MULTISPECIES: alpha/beta fold hydrolase [unclassified Caballeronia]|uniref:alpha/beta fold hydrolase n=1 Tax=unclassified Caballeronia TaxID=2646786 RepID=UPI00286746D0|nr:MULTISPECIES: alpha/beta fold hydrolase [unclassified Caballeronia]MDR5741060.1 alpha/beta fold hydrolase [Caballeronia sp. LZ016]MDR5806960.1 alpha/beta fold hydrolase [Caballeronia sp. LZ019]
MDITAAQALSSARPVIALHCSGSGAAQWRKLGEAIGSRHAFVAPEHYGCQSTGPWSGERAFTLADEAARTVGIIDASSGKVHLVGHSYGGGVALRAALERPGRIASLTLYEPSAFHLLKTMGAHGTHALAEIIAISKRTADGISCGDYRGAAASFVDYWGGPGAWEALRPSVQAALTRWAPKAPLDFRALLEERTPASAYTALRVPALIMRGQHAPVPTRAIAERLRVLLPAARLAVIPGAGHMGPVTHADEVNAAIVRHIAEADATIRSKEAVAMSTEAL